MQVNVTIPATSANLGPGFDCLGLALGLYNEIRFTAVETAQLSITASGVDADKVPTDRSNLVVEAADVIFQHVGRRPTGLIIHQENSIPVGSGMGSSSTAVLGGMLGANALLGSPLTPAQVLQFATDLEGHPDNVAPALYGGLILGVQEPDGLFVERIAMPEITAVVVLPDFHLLTATARAALPREVPLRDAIFNSSRMGLLVRALAEADYARLSVAMRDRLHQPYRMPLIPGMAAAFDAAYASGAAAAAISGAGPSLIAFAPDKHAAIATAVQEAFAGAGLASRSWILPVDQRGACVQVPPRR